MGLSLSDWNHYIIIVRGKSRLMRIAVMMGPPGRALQSARGRPDMPI
jgi:hypothetical protein